MIVVVDEDVAAVVDFALNRTVDAFAAASLVAPIRTYLTEQPMEIYH